MKKIVKTTSGEYLLQYATADELMNIPDGTDAQPFIDMLESVRKTGAYHYPTYQAASQKLKQEVDELQAAYNKTTVYIARTGPGLYELVKHADYGNVGLPIMFIARLYAESVIQELTAAEKTGEMPTSIPATGDDREWDGYLEVQLKNATLRMERSRVIEIVRTDAGLYLIDPSSGNIPNSTFVVAIEAEHAPEAVKLLTAARALEPKLRTMNGQFNVSREVARVLKVPA